MPHYRIDYAYTHLSLGYTGLHHFVSRTLAQSERTCNLVLQNLRRQGQLRADTFFYIVRGGRGRVSWFVNGEGLSGVVVWRVVV